MRSALSDRVRMIQLVTQLSMWPITGSGRRKGVGEGDTCFTKKRRKKIIHAYAYGQSVLLAQVLKTLLHFNNELQNVCGSEPCLYCASVVNNFNPNLFFNNSHIIQLLCDLRIVNILAKGLQRAILLLESSST